MFNPKDYSDNFVIEKVRQDYVLKEYTGAVEGTLHIPEGITKISDLAFQPSWLYDYSKIRKIVFPKTLKKIPNCFRSWSNLEEIIIPEGIETIDDGAFFDNNSIKEITLPSTLNRIGEGAFSLCKNLKKITLKHLSSKILNSLMQEQYADYSDYRKDSSPKLQFKIYVGSTEEVELSQFFQYYSRNNEKVQFLIQNWFVMYGKYIVGYIGKEKNLTLPESAIGIAYEAFINNKNIESVVCNDKLKKIGRAAFEGCSSLRKIELNSKLEEIYEFAFADTALKYIRIPFKVKYVGEGIFEGCNFLESVVVQHVVGELDNQYSWDNSWSRGLDRFPKTEFIFKK